MALFISSSGDEDISEGKTLPTVSKIGSYVETKHYSRQEAFEIKRQNNLF